ncbi:MAG: sigma-54-dependent Fis family transcriptional regulator [Deltaproteobacteria bacterium]|nr:sigma-54-dependent Fis family transcriptional regulator [Deltaproteobacteria bacterium]MBW2119179.1 sigma-54-dependent Fis family transcriptional regulator [Deltaproteobacteria bacterium]MBW2344650.1 sigma-54-dependent Fis family transcriptional regulator [Deltaproteobacteria bacterium]
MVEKANRLLEHLMKLAEQVSRGRYGKPEEIFELTKTGSYPERIVELAESFGMMIVKVEAREYQLQQTIEDLKKANSELDAARKQLAHENVNLRHNLRRKFSPSRIIGQSPGIRDILDKIEKVADTPIHILITGETGTGKELFAKAIHYYSSRNSKPFVALNCSALPETLIESELFGIEKGVATGVEKRIGKIEQADGGTLFLDEIGDMPLASQAKILRVLQEHELERLGGRKNISVDIKIIAATNKDLRQEVKNKTFREDLFYRLNVLHLDVPPLKERKDDIPLLLKAFCDSYAKNLNRFPMKFDPGVMEKLRDYPWPGNVRELENEIERAVALSFSDTITMEDFSEQVLAHFSSESFKEIPATDNLREMEIATIKKVISDVKGNKTETARRLGLSREGLRKKMNRYGIS